MTRTPQLWPRDPGTVFQDFNARHPAGTLPDTFMWALGAAEGSAYLEKLDAGPIPSFAPCADVVDISHVRWATANAITAIDLCAATIGRLFCGVSGTRDLSLRDFDPTASPKAKVAGHRGKVPPNAQDFLQWVDDTRADQRYIELHNARNPFTHSWLQRHLSVVVGSPADRTQFTVRGTSLRMDAPDMVVRSASLALDRVRAFVDVVDQY